MAKIETVSTRSPRGTKPVSEAFFAALARIPAASRAVVAKAAQAMIRDEIKTQRDKAKAAGARQKTVKPVAAKALATVTKGAAAKHPAAAKSLAKKTGPTKAAGTKASAPAPKAKAPKAATSVRAKKAVADAPEAKPAETAVVA